MSTLNTATTNSDLDWFPEIIPGFDALALKAKVQAEILEETKHMTRQEVLDYFHKAAERFTQRREVWKAEQAAKSQQ